MQSAYEKAKRHKSQNSSVQEFEKHWKINLCILMNELRTQTYEPLPLKKFILRDPKTRRICVSNFRDRVVHHALVNILQPIFEPMFIYDSFASREGKGTLAASRRLDMFLHKITKNGKLVQGARNNNVVKGFAFKADIRHYFETVDHEVLVGIIQEHIKDEKIIWLIRMILGNYNSGVVGKGMPLGNWTSQFFANIYLNELDQYVKHELKVKYYLRYVDDFLILHNSKLVLEEFQVKIKEFLKILQLELHPNKCKISPICCGIGWLGFRVFYHYKLIRQRNIRSIKGRLIQISEDYSKNICDAQHVVDVMNGWNAYAMQGNTYSLRKRLKNETLQKLGIIAKRRNMPVITAAFL